MAGLTAANSTNLHALPEGVRAARALNRITRGRFFPAAPA
jgi:hypothetical protein